DLPAQPVRPAGAEGEVLAADLVRAEGDGLHGQVVEAQDRRVLVAGQVPDLDRLVGRRGGQARAVGVDRQPGYRAVVPLVRVEVHAPLAVPHLDGPVRTGRDVAVLAVQGVIGQAVDRALVARGEEVDLRLLHLTDADDLEADGADRVVRTAHRQLMAFA